MHTQHRYTYISHMHVQHVYTHMISTSCVWRGCWRMKSRWSMGDFFLSGTLMPATTRTWGAPDSRALARCSGSNRPAFILGANPQSSAQLSSRVVGVRRWQGELTQRLPPLMGRRWVSMVILPTSLYPPAGLWSFVPKLGNSRQVVFSPFPNHPPFFSFSETGSCYTVHAGFTASWVLGLQAETPDPAPVSSYWLPMPLMERYTEIFLFCSFVFHFFETGSHYIYKTLTLLKLTI